LCRTSGRINSIAISPADPKIVLVGAATGGIWRSTDGGETFAPVSDNQVDLAVGYISFAPSNPNVVYAGMGDVDNSYLGTGVLKSTDAGKTWQRVSNDTLPPLGFIMRLEVDPKDANRVYVAQFARLFSGGLFSSGFYYSADGGVNWKRTLIGLPRDLVLSPADSKTLYVGIVRVDQPGNPPAGLYRSTDGGETWSLLYASPYASTSDLRVAVTPADPNRIYVYVGGFPTGVNTRELRLATSTDNGSTWESRRLNGLIDTGQFGYNTYLFADPSQANTLYIGTRDVFKSTDGGASWDNLNNSFTLTGGYTPRRSNAHPDQHIMAFLPGNSSAFFIGNDGGLYKTEDGGKTFKSKNQTLSLSQFVGLAISPFDPRLTVGGTQDNGSQLRDLDGQWYEIVGGDGGNVVFSPQNPNLFFTTYVFGAIFRLSGNVFRQVGTEAIFGEFGSPRIRFYAPFTGTNDGRLYFGTWRLFLSRNQGDTWYTPGWGFDLTKNPSDTINAIGVSNLNSDVIYTGSAQGRVMVTQDGGDFWTEITRGLPNRTIKSIVTDPRNPAVAYLTVSGYASGHVFKTTNYGANWRDISGNLPDIPTNALAFDPLTPGVIYVGTDIGVFRSTNDGLSWEILNQGMPPVVVMALAAHPSGIIQAATYGRGIYELNLRTNTADKSSPVPIHKEN
jgi:photosystem II stability/assembly factor-like uncharacterized protein